MFSFELNAYTEAVYFKITAAQMQVESNQFNGCASEF